MADFKSSVIIERPIKEVFEYMIGMENVSEIMPNVVKMEKITDGPLQPGTKFMETRMIRGREMQNEIELIEYQENRSYATKSEINGLGTIYRYDFQEIEEGTQVQFEAEVQTKGLWMKLTKKFIVDMIKKEDGFQLKYLKEEMEGKK